MRIVPERNIYGQETKEILTKHLHNDASNAVVNSSFDQMSFWRNRFESERIKSFLEKKESTTKLENAKAETPTSKKSKSRQREPVSGNKKMEPNFVTKAPQFKIKERHETNRKVTPKQDSPRIMKPVMTNEYNNRKIKPFIHRTSMTENNSRHRLSEVTQAQERTVEALPFVSQQERHSEEDQVARFEEWSKRTGPEVITKQKDHIQRNWKTHGWAPLNEEQEDPQIFPTSPSLFSISRKVGNKFHDIQKMGTNVVAVSSASPVAAPPATPPLVFPSVATQLTGQEPVTGSGVNTEQSIERPLGITIEEKIYKEETTDQPYKSQIRWLGRDVKERLKKKKQLPLEEQIIKNIKEEEIDSVEHVSERRVSMQDIPVEDNMDVKDPYEDAQGREAIDDLVLATEDFSSEDIAVFLSEPEVKAHIPIYLELPEKHCPVFCIRVNVEVVRQSRQLTSRCRSSRLCRAQDRRRR